MEKECDVLAVGKSVLQTEASALVDLKNALDESFTRAVEALANAKGRVIVTGMGKSGHIAHKIAASMSSLGTTAYFVHPGEASHGDLGMIEPDDIVIALSNSGDSPELSDIIAFCHRFNITLIGMTGRREGTLAKRSRIVLCLPPLEEACPFGLAPTTSTTLMLALGDALAIALLEKRHFSKEQYKMRHPGGKLGKLMLNAADLMHSGDEMPLVRAETKMSDALIVMTEKSLGCVGVVDENGDLQGIVTDGDLRRKMSADLLTRSAGEIMTANPRSVTRETSAADVVRIMNTTGKGITGLFVLDGKKPVGFVHIHDCLRAGVA